MGWVDRIHFVPDGILDSHFLWGQKMWKVRKIIPFVDVIAYVIWLPVWLGRRSGMSIGTMYFLWLMRKPTFRKTWDNWFTGLGKQRVSSESYWNQLQWIQKGKGLPQVGRLTWVIPAGQISSRSPFLSQARSEAIGSTGTLRFKSTYVEELLSKISIETAATADFKFLDPGLCNKLMSG